ncbi:MAG: M14 family metallopeptidase [Negativicutes bacterium]|nr:M14 family metallopeptidase [Negativicutes bacterium]
MLKLKYDHYYAYDELTAALRQLQAGYPKLANLLSIGQSPQGRQQWLMEITDPATGAAADKPAYYIDGNHHAGEVTGAMVALYTIDYLLSEAATNPAVQSLLQRYTFYILPRVSPDGAEVYLTTPDTLRSVPRMYPEPEILPGLLAQDIDGNGEILLMRVRSKSGEWKAAETDDRLMLKRLPDEEDGVFYRIFSEGILQQYNGGEIEAAPAKWGMDLNRNYPCQWGVEAKQAGAGAYPLSEPETHHVADFVLAHPNIGSASTLHTTGGVILRPPGIKPEKQAPKLDVSLLKAIGEMATAETGYPCINIYDEFFSDPSTFSSGAFDDWLYGHLGIPAYTIELWDLANRAGVKDIWPRRDKTDKVLGEDFAKILAWNDEVLAGKGFVNWTKFQHPQLGEVEIGGFHTKTVVQNCPSQFLPEECAKVSRFMLRHARTLPRLTAEEAKAEKIDHNSWKVSLLVCNIGYLPTHLTQEALNLQAAKEVTVELSGAKIVDGTPAKRKIGHLAGRAGRSGKFENGAFRSGHDEISQKQVSWLVQGSAGDLVTILIQSQKAGKLQVRLNLA